MVLKPKLLTPRLSQRRAIYSLNMSTLTPFRLRVARVNQSHIHPSAEVRRVRLTDLFVGDECLKSGKAPSKQSVALNLSPLGSTTNAGVSEAGRSPVFKYQCTTTKRPSQALTQQMVTVFSKASLSAQQLFQISLGRFRAFRLPSPVQLKGFVFYSLLMVRIILATPAVGSWGNNTQSHHNLSPCSRSFNLHDNVQPPSPFVSQQVGAGVFLFLLLTAIFSRLKGQFDLSVESENRHFSAVKPNDVRPLNVLPNQATLGRINGLALLFESQCLLQSFSGIKKSGADQLRRQTSSGAMVVVGSFVQLHAIRHVVFPSIFAHGIERPGVFFNRLRKHLGCFEVDFKLNTNHSLPIDRQPPYRTGVIC